MLANLIDLLVQLRRDEERDREFLRHRDREIGRRLAPLGLAPRARLLAWLAALSEAPDLGHRVALVQRSGNGLLVLLGLLAGWAAARVLLQYDGSQPVNVLHALAVFVGLQLLLVALLGLTLLPRRATRWAPGLRTLQEALGALSPGRLLRLGQRFLPQEVRRLLAAAVGRGNAQQRLLGRVQKWALVGAAQWFGVAFNVGALLGCLYLVASSDLAFAWSTTLDVEADYLYRLTRGLAAPWAGWVPQAVPSLELIEATRYFRLKDGTLPGHPVDPAVLGGWWPFLLAAISCYGLFLRTLLLGFAGWRFRRAVAYALVHAPGVQDLWDRLDNALVETRAVQPEAAGDLPSPGAGRPGQPSLENRACVLVNWAGVELGHWDAAKPLWQTLGLEPRAVFCAGGTSSLEDDRNVVADLARAADSGPIVILVKGWEPALLEFLDFLVDLRRALGDGVPITVLPVGQAAADGAAAPRPADLAQWRARAQSLGDPWVSVRSPAAAATGAPQ